jgi:hypothetical protein
MHPWTLVGVLQQQVNGRVGKPQTSNPACHVPGPFGAVADVGENWQLMSANETRLLWQRWREKLIPT